MDFHEYPLLHYQDLMLALLKVAENGPATLDDAVSEIKANFREIDDMLPASEAELLTRLAEPRNRLQEARLLRMVEDGRFHLTDRGRIVLAEHPGGIDDTVLMQFREFRQFMERRNAANTPEDPSATEYDLGYIACQAGRSITDNPFEPDSLQHAAWTDGWSEACAGMREQRRP